MLKSPTDQVPYGPIDAPWAGDGTLAAEILADVVAALGPDFVLERLQAGVRFEETCRFIELFLRQPEPEPRPKARTPKAKAKAKGGNPLGSDAMRRLVDAFSAACAARGLDARDPGDGVELVGPLAAEAPPRRAGRSRK